MPESRNELVVLVHDLSGVRVASAPRGRRAREALGAPSAAPAVLQEQQLLDELAGAHARRGPSRAARGPALSPQAAPQGFRAASPPPPAPEPPRVTQHQVGLPPGARCPRPIQHARPCPLRLRDLSCFVGVL